MWLVSTRCQEAGCCKVGVTSRPVKSSNIEKESQSPPCPQKRARLLIVIPRKFYKVDGPLGNQLFEEARDVKCAAKHEQYRDYVVKLK